MDKAMFYKLECPRCNSPVRAKVDRKVYRFLLYKCPFCESNVVYYGNNVDVLSDAFVKILMDDNNIVYCGNASLPKISPSNEGIIDEEITLERIADFKILLNTEKNFDKFLSKI